MVSPRALLNCFSLSLLVGSEVDLAAYRSAVGGLVGDLARIYPEEVVAVVAPALSEAAAAFFSLSDNDDSEEALWVRLGWGGRWMYGVWRRWRRLLHRPL